MTCHVCGQQPLLIHFLPKAAAWACSACADALAPPAPAPLEVAEPPDPEALADLRRLCAVAARAIADADLARAPGVIGALPNAPGR